MRASGFGRSSRAPWGCTSTRPSCSARRCSHRLFRRADLEDLEEGRERGDESKSSGAPRTSRWIACTVSWSSTSSTTKHRVACESGSSAVRRRTPARSRTDDGRRRSPAAPSPRRRISRRWPLRRQPPQLVLDAVARRATRRSPWRAPRRAAWRARRPATGPDRRQVRGRGPQQLEPIALGLRRRLLVGQHVTGAGASRPSAPMTPNVWRRVPSRRRTSSGTGTARRVGDRARRRRASAASVGAASS